MGTKSNWKMLYKINVYLALSSVGYTSTRLRAEKIIGSATVTRIRRNLPVSWDILAQLCELLECDICDIVEIRDENGRLARPNPDLFKQFPAEDYYTRYDE